MRLSNFLLSTLKEAPADAETESHKLMIRAGMIRKVAAGIYNFLPTGLRVFRKVENIIREEMNRANAIEVMMPFVTPSDLWEKSGRWDVYGKELLRFKDRADREEKPKLRSGETIEQAIETANTLNVSALLFNCSQVEEMKDVLDIVQKSDLEIPYGVYANAFEPIKQDQDVSTDGLTIRDDNSVSDYYNHALKWVSQGATIIGGCCGIGPEHIKELTKLNE